MAVSPIEIATSMVFGLRSHADVSRASRYRSVRAAMEGAIASAVTSGRQVYVSFSGGRDSSAVLALAAHVARREGMPDPVPVTLVASNLPLTDEGAWQHLVLDQLGCKERITIEMDDEFGLLGPIATRLMQRHGLLWPPNAYLHDAMAEQCRGGVLLTGGGGDELFDGSQPNRTQQVLRLVRLPTPRDAARLAFSLALPRAHRRRRARYVEGLPWLTAAGTEEFRAVIVADDQPPYRGWSTFVRRLQRSRAVAALKASTDLIGDAHGVRVEHPFFDVGVLAAAARSGGYLGPGGRTEAMRQLVGDLLPPELITRTSKASFSEVVWSRDSLAEARRPEVSFALGDDPLVRRVLDPRGFQSALAETVPHYMLATAVQCGWLAGRK